MLQPDFFLKKYGIDSIVKKLPEDEGFIRMIETFGARETYDGDEPYIFVSYCHDNSALVLPAIKAMQDKGYPVWYDAGINPGTEWLKVIADRIDKASLVIAFVSQESVVSRYCQSEIARAFNKEKPLLEVRLDRCELPGDMEMQLNRSQRFNAYAYDNGDRYVELLANTPILSTYIKTKRMKEAEAAERKRREAEEAERKRREAEAAERKRREAEEAERKRREAEAAERKRREAEAAERKRREAEAAERKRQEVQAAERRKKQQQEEAEKEEQRKKWVAERANSQKNMEKCDQEIQALLKSGSHGMAIFKYNYYLRSYAKPELALEIELESYQSKLCSAVYRDACELEKSQKTRDRVKAESLFDALPHGYLDAGIHKAVINKQIKEIEKKFSWIVPLTYLVTNFAIVLFVLPWIQLWFWKMLVLTIPMMLYCGMDVYLRLGLGVDSMDIPLFTKMCVAVILIMNPFLMHDLGILWRIVVSVGATALVYAIMYFFAWHIGSGWSSRYRVSSIDVGGNKTR